MTREAEWGLTVIAFLAIALIFIGAINAKIERTVAETVKEQCEARLK